MLSMAALVGGMLCLLAGCATSYGKGVTSQGDKVYLGPIPIEGTEAYQAYIRGGRSEVAKQNYLFNSSLGPRA